MKMFKKIVLFLMVIIITTTTVMYNIKNNIQARVNLTANTRNVTNIGVSFFDFNNPYLGQVRQKLKEIEKNKGNVKFDFFDGKNNIAIQNENIDYLINHNYDLLLLNLINKSESEIEYVLNKVKAVNKPLILFNVEPLIIPSVLKSYNKVIIISSNAKQSGILQGKLLINAWNLSKMDIDKNNDNVMQYVMIIGENNDTGAIQRTKYSISTINDAGIKTQELASTTCNWSEECAKNAIENLFLKFGNRIEVIIANNDAMAIGAIEGLQKYGYNTGNKSKYIPVVGIDAIPKAKELVAKGLMEGTVFQDPDELANALYTVGMNLVYNKYPLEGTNYKFNETGITIETPYYEYIK